MSGEVVTGIYPTAPVLITWQVIDEPLDACALKPNSIALD